MEIYRSIRTLVLLLVCGALPLVSHAAEDEDTAKMLSQVVRSGGEAQQQKSEVIQKAEQQADEANPDYLDLSLTHNGSEKLLYLRQAIDEALASNLEIKIEAIAPGIASERIIQALAAFDPTFEARIRYENLRTPQTTQEFVSTGGSPIINNAANRGGGGNLPGRTSRIFDEENVRSDLLLTGRLVTGTEYELGVKSNRFSNDLTRDSLITAIDPEYRAFAGLSFTQPLLQGFGIEVNKTPILISQSEKRIASLQFKSLASKIVKEVVAAYYDLYLSYEDVKVKKFDIGVAQVQVAEKREQLERGAATERDVAKVKTLLLQSYERFLLARQTMLTKNSDLLLKLQTDFDPLTHSVYLPQSAPSIDTPPLDRANITEDALNYRPEYLAATETVKKLNIELKYRRNQKMPKLDIEATIGTLGLSDEVARAYSKAFENQGHEYGVGLVFSLPLGNRKTKAMYRETQKVSSQAILRVKWEEVQANILIDQMLTGVETHQKRISAARHTREAEQMNLERARDNLEKGTSTETVVRVIEHAVLEARLREMAAAGDLQKALLGLWDVNGTLLQRFGILIDSEIDREPTVRFAANGEMIASRPEPKINKSVSLNEMATDESGAVVEVPEKAKKKSWLRIFQKKKIEQNSGGEGEFVPYEEAMKKNQVEPALQIESNAPDLLANEEEVEEVESKSGRSKRFRFWKKKS